jgi:hypothetical protein
MLIVFEYTVRIVLSSVGVLFTVMGTLKGSGVKVVFAAIEVTTSIS